MPSRQKGEIEELAIRVQYELQKDAKEIAKKLFPEVPPDAEHLTRDQYLRYVRRHWPDQEFRLNLLRRVGPKNFINTAKAALTLTEAPVPLIAPAADAAEPSPVVPSPWTPTEPAS